jgi:hypothetical protein
MFMVSTIPWALSVALPRFAAAVGWLVVVVGAAATLQASGLESWFHSASLEGSGAAAASMFVIYPLVTVGDCIRAAEAISVAPGLAFAAGATAAALWWVAGADFPLEAAQ